MFPPNSAPDMTYLQGKQYVYKLEVGLLGEGSYGKVQKATRVATQEVYACKSIEITEQPLSQSERVSGPFLQV